MKNLRVAMIAAGVGLSALSLGVAAQAADPLAAKRMGPWGFDLTGQDRTTSPGKDLSRFATGAFTDKLVIPADRSRWGSFDELRELSDARSRAIIEAAAADPSSPEAAQIGALYASFMDETRVNALGAKPLAKDLAAIRAAKTKPQIAALMGKAMSTFTGSFFGAYVSDDQKIPGRYALYLSQGGLGLPDRDYYLKPAFAEKKAAYQAYVAQTLTAIGWSDPAVRAAEIVALETEIAQVSWTRAERRDDVKMYNPTSPKALAEMAPGFPWSHFLQAAGLAEQPRLVVGETSAFPKIAAIFASASIPTLQAWQAFTTTDNAAPYLSKAFVDAHFNFRGKTLSGQPEQRPRWKRGVAAVDGNLGESVGKLYVAKYFTPQAKAQMEALVGNLKLALKARIEKLEWMGPDTKAEALTKLARMNVKIGYPSKWRDYSNYVVRKDDLYGNVERGVAFEWAHNLDKLSKPVDREEWEMFPQTVNAYFMPPKNEIVFPAAILAPPFFDPEADPAVNYGGIGAVIGHEITHAFDDQGRQSDADGQLRDWWTPQDAERFMAQAKRLGDQYQAFEPLPGARINGELTMGENIADMGGVLIGYDAYLISLGGKPAPVIDGYTGAQRFFLSWAQVWRGKIRDDALRQQLVSDPHSPAYYRANGAVRNSDVFYEAFGVKPGDPMYVPPEERVRIW
jgi:putative endopeptidase